MFGAIIGIPIALALNRKQQKEQEEIEQQAKNQEASERKAKILKLVKEELEHNRDHIRKSQEDPNGVSEGVIHPNGLKDELWNAFSDGGELEWIRDLQLLHIVSLAYHYIRRAAYLERLYLQYKYYPGTRADSNRFPGEAGLSKWLTQLYPTVLDFIEKALKEIDTSMTELESSREATIAI
jgi:hypothetical protein